jgi:hypothetical protein
MKPLLGLLLALASASTAAADEAGRYQAIPLSRPDNSLHTQALILDTRDGHLWLWNSQPGIGGQTQVESLIYEGQLRPGHAMGEVIEHSGK